MVYYEVRAWFPVDRLWAVFAVSCDSGENVFMRAFGTKQEAHVWAEERNYWFMAGVVEDAMHQGV